MICYCICESFSLVFVKLNQAGGAVNDSERKKPDDLTPGTIPVQPPVYDSAVLFGACREIFIRHAAELYRLRVTRQNKLILTK